MIRLSIIIKVLESYEVLRRQLIHLRSMDHYGIEILIMDDGSQPSLFRYLADLGEDKNPLSQKTMEKTYLA